MTDKTHDTLTLVARRSPYGESGARATLDIAFAAAVFDRQVRYVFLGDGVWQLKKDSGTAASNTQNKLMGSALETIELYGIEQVYALTASLEERNLAPAELIEGVTLIDEITLRDLLSGPDAVINL